MLYEDETVHCPLSTVQFSSFGESIRLRVLISQSVSTVSPPGPPGDPGGPGEGTGSVPRRAAGSGALAAPDVQQDGDPRPLGGRRPRGSHSTAGQAQG